MRGAEAESEESCVPEFPAFQRGGPRSGGLRTVPAFSVGVGDSLFEIGPRVNSSRPRYRSAIFTAGGRARLPPSLTLAMLPGHTSVVRHTTDPRTWILADSGCRAERNATYQPLEHGRVSTVGASRDLLRLALITQRKGVCKSRNRAGGGGDLKVFGHCSRRRRRLGWRRREIERSSRFRSG